MIFRVFRIVLAFVMLGALWLSYGQLGLLRGTVFWEFRYIIWIITSFLLLSVVEWGFGKLYSKFHSE